MLCGSGVSGICEQVAAEAFRCGARLVSASCAPQGRGDPDPWRSIGHDLGLPLAPDGAAHADIAGSDALARALTHTAADGGLVISLLALEHASDETLRHFERIGDLPVRARILLIGIYGEEQIAGAGRDPLLDRLIRSNDARVLRTT